MYEETLVIRNKSEYLITEFDNRAKDMSETFGMGIWWYLIDDIQEEVSKNWDFNEIYGKVNGIFFDTSVCWSLPGPISGLAPADQ